MNNGKDRNKTPQELDVGDLEKLQIEFQLASQKVYIVGFYSKSTSAFKLEIPKNKMDETYNMLKEQVIDDIETGWDNIS